MSGGIDANFDPKQWSVVVCMVVAYSVFHMTLVLAANGLNIPVEAGCHWNCIHTNYNCLGVDEVDTHYFLDHQNVLDKLGLCFPDHSYALRDDQMEDSPEHLKVTLSLGMDQDVPDLPYL